MKSSARSTKKASPTADERFTFIALLRGINVGGKNKLPMKELALLFGEAGCSEVATYIQSGNVVFGAPATLADGLPTAIEKAILKRFALRVPIVMRSARELEVAIRDNPFLKAGVDPDKLHLAFLGDAPSADRVSALDRNRSPGDEWHVLGRDLYLHLPNGVGKSKLTNAYFDSKLETVSTIRNWRTVVTLVEMSKRS